MLRLISTCLLLGLSQWMFAQTTFQKQVEGVNGLFCLEQNLAGDFWIGTFQGKILRFDAQGQWLGGFDLKSGDTSSARYVYDLQRLPDGGMLALYDRSNFNNDLDDYLIAGRFDASGNVVWQQSVHFGEVQHWAHNRICTDASGNIFAISARYAGAGTDKLLVVSKVSAQGVLLWRKAYSTPGANYARAVKVLSNGDLLICGNGQLAANFGFTLRLSPNGNLVSSRQYSSLIFKDILEKPDGTWLFAATANGPMPQTAVLLHTDTAGMVLWANRINMPNVLNWSPQLAFNATGDVVVFNHETPKQVPVADMMCFTASGAFRWARRYDRCHNYGISAGIATNDGGLAGLRFRPGGQLFLKTDAQGQCFACTGDSLSIPVSPTSGAGYPLIWEQQNMPPINPASINFLPFNVLVNDFCGNKKPVDSLRVSNLQPCTNEPVSAQTMGTATANDYDWLFNPGMPAVATGVSSVSGIKFAQAGPASIQVVVSEGFCSDTFFRELLVQEGPPPFDLGPDTLLCSPVPGLVINFSDTDNDAFIWNDAFFGPLRTIQSAGTYILRMDLFGCSLSDTIRITLANQVAVGLPSDTLACGVDSLSLDVSGLDADAYFWSDGIEAPRRFIYQTGYYGVTAFFGPCPASDYMYVDFKPAPPPLPADTLVCEGVALRLDVGKSTQGFISWNGEPGYAAYVFDSAGWVQRRIEYKNCLFEDSVLVRREECFETFVYYAPNVFSPNGDGENDRFELFGDGLEVLHLQVYDRWGAMVAESRDAPAAFWESQDVQPGVYTWVAQVRQRGREGRVAGGVAVVR